MNVLILENIDEALPSGLKFDHIFSFRYDRRANLFPYHLINEDEAASIYREVYHALLERLKIQSEESPFIYRGVNLLWCLKKPIFNFAHHVKLRFETFKRLAKKFESADFYLKRRSPHPEYPTLDPILQSSPRQKTPIHFLEEKEEGVSLSAHSNPSRLQRFWPPSLAWGRLEKSKIAFFSAFERSKSILQYLKADPCAYYVDEPAPRLFLRCLQRGIAFYQAAPPSKNPHASEKSIHFFLNALQEAPVFPEAENLLNLWLEELIRSIFPKLLFQIDQMHRFFVKAKALRSVFLDEDIAPVKNAFCQIARRYGIPSYVESHGVLAHPSGYIPVTADFLFAWGEAQKKKLVSWGCPEEQILVSGCSRYTSYRERESESVRKKVKKDLGLDPSKKILLVTFPLIRANRPLLFESRWVHIFYETLEEIATFHPEISLVIKFKAYSNDQNRKYCEAWLQEKKLGDRFKIVEKYDSLLLARAADLLVAYGTTFAVDGLAMKVPVIYLYHQTMPLLDEFKEYNAFYFSDSRAELRGLIRNLLQGQHPKKDAWKRVYEECLSSGGNRIPAELIAARLKGENSKSSDRPQRLHFYESQNTSR